MPGTNVNVNVSPTHYCVFFANGSVLTGMRFVDSKLAQGVLSE